MALNKIPSLSESVSDGLESGTQDPITFISDESSKVFNLTS